MSICELAEIESIILKSEKETTVDSISDIVETISENSDSIIKFDRTSIPITNYFPPRPRYILTFPEDDGFIALYAFR